MPSLTLEQAEERSTLITEDVPELLIEVTTRSLIDTFEKMIGDTTIDVPAEQSKQVEGVVGLISFVGDVTWSLAMMFPQKAAESLALKFAGFEIEYESADMGVVVGEIANVLAGVICG
jgi:CheY-specific phosphatase CheX